MARDACEASRNRSCGSCGTAACATKRPSLRAYAMIHPITLSSALSTGARIFLMISITFLGTLPRPAIGEEADRQRQARGQHRLHLVRSGADDTVGECGNAIDESRHQPANFRPACSR